jgi:hypothetical protein
VAHAGGKRGVAPWGRPRSGLSARLAGWTNAGLALLAGGLAAIGFVAGGLTGADSPLLVLLATLLAGVASFLLAGRPFPATILAGSLLLLGLFVAVGLLVGAAMLGAPPARFTMAVAAAAAGLAALETWSIVAVWGSHARRTKLAGRADGPHDDSALTGGGAGTDGGAESTHGVTTEDEVESKSAPGGSTAGRVKDPGI